LQNFLKNSSTLIKADRGPDKAFRGIYTWL
jgi:hypothetical protein